MTGKVHAVDPVRVVLVGGPGVSGENPKQGTGLVLRQTLQQGRRAVHLQLGAAGGGEAPQGLRVAVCVGEVGLDVQNGGAVHEVGPRDDELGAVGGVEPDLLQLHGGEADGVGPEGGAGGKDPHALVAPQPGRPDGGGPAGAH